LPGSKPGQYLVDNIAGVLLPCADVCHCLICWCSLAETQREMDNFQMATGI